MTNIRERRGSKISTNIPIFRDSATPMPFYDPTVPPGTLESLPNHIFLDSTGFGTGCSCLQITMQGSSMHEARRMYDAMVPLTPLMLSLSSAAPCFKGYLTDCDNRWAVLRGVVDDRTAEERGLEVRFRLRLSEVSCELTASSLAFSRSRLRGSASRSHLTTA